MKFKISILVLLILSFINIGCLDNKYSMDFNKLERVVGNKSDFVENAVKFQYLSKNNFDNEICKIKNAFKGYSYSCISNNRMKKVLLEKDKINVEADLWYENDELHVEMVINNHNKNYSTNVLYKYINIIDDDSVCDEQYYYYYKGEIKESIINSFVNNINLKNPKLLKINNGYTGVAKLNDNQKLNFAEVKYDSGLYIIIATPIIFTTY